MKSIQTALKHPIPPLYSPESRTLILGSFPSVKSRESEFFYGHPQNRFWKVIAGVFGEEIPQTIEDKKAMVIKNHLALWDTIGSCTIIGSSDSSIRDVIPNDISIILKSAPIERIFCNGNTSLKFYIRYIKNTVGIDATVLPSTSPANAAWSLEKLIAAWSIIDPN